VIPKTAVEAATEVVWEMDDDLQSHEYAKEIARAALEAAAPHLMAAAWDEATKAIIDFLEARLAAEETDAIRDCAEMERSGITIMFDCESQATFDPYRILAECKAKRAILANIPRNSGPYNLGAYTSAHTVRALAAVYSDHLDYRQEWA